MEPEFLDPGPDQPPPPPGYPPAHPPAVAPGRPTQREMSGLLITLGAAGLLAVIAARQDLYSAVEQTVVGRSAFSVAAGGDYHVTDGPPLAGHAPRYGVLLTIAGVAFLLLALLAVVRLAAGRAYQPARVAGGLAGAATGLVGLLVGVTVGMALQIQSAYSEYRSAAGVLELRMKVGFAVWLALAALLIGGLSVSGALRVRRAFGPAPFGY